MDAMDEKGLFRIGRCARVGLKRLDNDKHRFPYISFCLLCFVDFIVCLINDILRLKRRIAAMFQLRNDCNAVASLYS